MNKMYGFEGEVKLKYNSKMAELFTEIFNYLPLCHTINKKIFVILIFLLIIKLIFWVCHGGLFQEDGVTLDKLVKLKRFCQPPESGIMCDLLWSDPQNELGKAPSKRGVGIQFGPDVTKKFIEDNDLNYIIR